MNNRTNIETNVKISGIGYNGRRLTCSLFKTNFKIVNKNINIQ